MKKLFSKDTLREILPHTIYSFIKKKFAKKQLKDWQKKGCPAPPPHIVKQIMIQKYQKKYGYDVLVETGTFRGDMVEAQKGKFEKIFSIEIDDILFQKAKKTFKRSKNVTILKGDSGKILPLIIKDLNKPAIFWLDGHYSGGVTGKGDKECPIIEEINSILSNQKLSHVLLIDDARLFIGENDYPTLDELTTFVKSKSNKYQVTVSDDIIQYSI